MILSNQNQNLKRLIDAYCIIWDNGIRKNEEFVDVNCAAIPETLMESELFGHEKGAFTDAKKQRIGKFEIAGKGTLFLDEIGDMPIALQAKILRVLQEKKIMRVGGTSKINVNCRVISATNKNLKDEVQAGSFREDLFYRISAFPIIVPALKDRIDDVLLLVPHFLEKYAESKRIKTISSETMRLFLQYDWPGNIRELENAVYRATILADGDEIIAQDLPFEIREKNPAEELADSDNLLGNDILPFADMEKEIYRHALKLSKGNITQAAKSLKIGRTTFYRKLEKFGLS